MRSTLFFESPPRTSGLGPWLIGMCLILLLTPMTMAQTVQVVPWAQPLILISLNQEKLEAGVEAAAYPLTWTDPRRGQLKQSGGGLVYMPDEEFWEVGFDSFHLRESSTSKQYETVFLIAGLREEPQALGALEGCVLHPDWFLLGDAQVVQRPVAKSSTCLFEMTLGADVPTTLVGPKAQTGPGGGNTSISLDPGTHRSPGSFELLPGMETPVVAAITSQGETVFELVLREGLELFVRAYHSDGTVVMSKPVQTAQVRQDLELEWWFASTEGASDGGLLLVRDGVLETAVIGIDNFGLLGRAWNWHFGLLAPTVGASGTLALEQPEVWTSPRQPVYQPLFANGTDNVYSAQSAALRDASPSAERHYRARFFVGFEGVRSEAGGAWTLFRADDPGRGLVPFDVQVRSSLFRGLEVRARAWNGSMMVETPWEPLPEGRSSHDVAVQWWAQSDAQTPNGGLRLWVEGALTGGVSGLANASVRVEETYLGVLSAPLGGGGELVIHDFFAWR